MATHSKSANKAMWIAPDFSLSKHHTSTFKPKLPDVRKKDQTSLPPLSPELDNNISVARLLELADIAMGRKKRKKKGLIAA